MLDLTKQKIIGFIRQLYQSNVNENKMEEIMWNTVHTI